MTTDPLGLIPRDLVIGTFLRDGGLLGAESSELLLDLIQFAFGFADDLRPIDPNGLLEHSLVGDHRLISVAVDLSVIALRQEVHHLELPSPDGVLAVHAHEEGPLGRIL